MITIGHQNHEGLEVDHKVHHKSNIYGELEKFSKCSSDDLNRASDKHGDVFDTEKEPAGYGALEFTLGKAQVWSKDKGQCCPCSRYKNEISIYRIKI